MRMLFIVIASLGLATICIAQQSAPSPTPGRQAREIVTVDVPATSYRKVGQAEVSYYAESDLTEVRIDFSPYRGQEGSVLMYFVSNTKGKDVMPPTVVSVGLAVYGDRTRVAKVNGFSLEIDGVSHNLDDMTPGDSGLDGSTKEWFKSAKGTIPFTMFEKMVNSKSLKVHVAEIVFELGKEGRDGLRDMLSALGPRKAGF